ncbi:HpcH/HpaI aldolase/citrate lyase family protein [Candidatus Formimonas warabiya]|uniref:Citrate lyase subunit beta n=1 Tax=Formimonas warabiya TaxID=1761012 RepID=A0A3G1KS62_FORW1|nr:aldolase/citrate lyase family protein [Candidatus Formimonas warabiya]ATW24985.1 citrate lyase subunit beta [Candidatus Formimonas warabiya]
MSKLRRTMLFIPGNDPGKLQSAGIYRSDCLVFDLEDSVSVNEKDAARILVRNAIMYIEYPSEIGVRINGLDTSYGRDDLATILPAKPAFIRLPKAEKVDDIQELDRIISAAERKYQFQSGTIKIVLTIETAKGILSAYHLAVASPRVIGIGMGAEDLVADLKGSRTREGNELLFAKSQILYAARAAGVQAIDNVFSDVNDEEGFREDTNWGRILGYDGKSVIHPNHIPIVHEIYAPSEKEIDLAKNVLAAYQEAVQNKSGVIALNGKMIDGPVVTRAERVMQYARALGMIREEYSYEKCCG